MKAERTMWPFHWMMHKRRGLRMWVLSMLAAGPKNGVEIMKEVETLTRGWWRPSPGSVYPLLESLSEEGLVRRREDGRYELTKKASDQLEWSYGPPFRRPQSAEDMLGEIGGVVSYFEDLARSDPAKVAPHLEKLRKVEERLSALVRKKA